MVTATQGVKVILSVIVSVLSVEIILETEMPVNAHFDALITCNVNHQNTNAV